MILAGIIRVHRCHPWFKSFMNTLPVATAGLYAQVLGVRWHELAEAVRRLHTPGQIVRAVGTFRVRRGTNRLTRFAAWLARLPAEVDAVEMQLVVTPTGNGEEWRRHFGVRP